MISYRFKSAVREVGKALGIEETQLDFFIKNVNRRDRNQGWQAQIIELGLQPESLKGQQFIQLVNEIIGFPRHLSQHVGGFVISSGLYMNWCLSRMLRWKIARLFNGIKMI